jgi:hypothetical protein
MMENRIVTDSGITLVVVSLLLLLLVTVIVPMRIYVRARIVRYFGLDDWAIVVAAVSLPHFLSMLLLATRSLWLT